MTKCIFENLTDAQARTLADYFEGQGESDCVVWFYDRGVDPPLTSQIKYDGNDVIVKCRTPNDTIKLK